MSNLLESQGFSYLAECRAVLYVLIVNTVDAGCFLGNMDSGIDAPCLDFGAAVGHYLDHGYFHNAVSGNVETGALDVEKYNRILEIQFHDYGMRD